MTPEIEKLFNEAKPIEEIDQEALAVCIAEALKPSRLVLVEYRTEAANYIRRWLKPHTIVEAKHSCGCYDYQYARDVGKRPCILCSEENIQVSETAQD
jgi:hypothetical protein